ncbi:MAG: Maf family nucleotide pyrophosphatase [Cellvibrionaceae bacterium]|nr:Maf family nucleotide pyrophosphatase [Cellvibrionaceae bacterium]
MAKILLASSSPYRRQLLARLGLDFDWASPAIDETPNPAESPTELVQRLARAKAAALAERYPEHWIIGSDQVACHRGAIIGKPGNHQRALAQLRAFGGHSVSFYTGLCLMQGDRVDCATEEFIVHFLTLPEACLETYLQREQPYDCAGSFKSEGLGITLFERLEGDDPNSLVGLPLIRLCRMLRAVGIEPLRAS